MSSNEDDKILAELNAEYCVVAVGNKTRVMRFTKDHLGRQVPHYLAFDDFRKLLMNRHVAVGHKLVPLGTWWLEHPQRRTIKRNSNRVTGAGGLKT
jgi:hypothetical protein